MPLDKDPKGGNVLTSGTAYGTLCPIDVDNEKVMTSSVESDLLPSQDYEYVKAQQDLLVLAHLEQSQG